jgi:hypothetical protein
MLILAGQVLSMPSTASFLFWHLGIKYRCLTFTQLAEVYALLIFLHRNGDLKINNQPMKFQPLFLLTTVPMVDAFISPSTNLRPRIHAARFIRPRVASSVAASSTEEENGVDENYPWRFDGRLWFRPSFVRSPPPEELPIGQFG